MTYEARVTCLPSKIEFDVEYPDSTVPTADLLQMVA